MKIDEDSYYINYYIKDGKEYARMSHYKEVWDNGFTVDDYVISDCYISSEDACWNGVSPTLKEGTRILAKQFNQWVNEIKNAKTSLIRIGKKSSSLIVKKLKKGDCLLCLPFNDDTDEGVDFNWYSFLEVTHVDNKKIKAKEVLLDEQHFYYHKYLVYLTLEEGYRLDTILKKDLVLLVDKNVFNRSIEIIRQLSNKIMSEIKVQVKGEKITKL